MKTSEYKMIEDIDLPICKDGVCIGKVDNIRIEVGEAPKARATLTDWDSIIAYLNDFKTGLQGVRCILIYPNKEAKIEFFLQKPPKEGGKYWKTIVKDEEVYEYLESHKFIEWGQ